MCMSYSPGGKPGAGAAAAHLRMPGGGVTLSDVFHRAEATAAMDTCRMETAQHPYEDYIAMGRQQQAAALRSLNQASPWFALCACRGSDQTPLLADSGADSNIRAHGLFMLRHDLVVQII